MAYISNMVQKPILSFFLVNNHNLKAKPGVPKGQKKTFFLPKIDVHIYIVCFLSKFWGPDAILRSGFGLMKKISADTE